MCRVNGQRRPLQGQISSRKRKSDTACFRCRITAVLGFRPDPLAGKGIAPILLHVRAATEPGHFASAVDKRVGHHARRKRVYKPVQRDGQRIQKPSRAASGAIRCPGRDAARVGEERRAADAEVHGGRFATRLKVTQFAGIPAEVRGRLVVRIGRDGRAVGRDVYRGGIRKSTECLHRRPWAVVVLVRDCDHSARQLAGWRTGSLRQAKKNSETGVAVSGNDARVPALEEAASGGDVRVVERARHAGDQGGSEKLRQHAPEINNKCLIIQHGKLGTGCAPTFWAGEICGGSRGTQNASLVIPHRRSW